MRKLVGALTFASLSLCATSAFAQMENFGKQGSMGFSAERLFGFYSLHLGAEDRNGTGYDETVTGFGFGWGADSYPFNIPRFAFDYFVIDQLSIGGSIGYASYSHDNNNRGGGLTGSAELFLLAARVGYWIPIGGVVGFWPRGGFTYHSLNPDGNNNNENGFALTLEGMFGIGPFEHFAFLAGPTFDIDFIGHHDCQGPGGTNDSCSYKYRNIGIQVGLMGWL